MMPATGQPQDAVLPLRFLATGLGAWILAVWGLVLAAPHLAAGQVLSGPVLAVLHLAALGWLTMVAMGASCQLLPVALGAKLWRPGVAKAVFWLQASGVVLMVWGFARFDVRLLVPGTLTVWSAVALFLVMVTMTLLTTPKWTMTAGYMGLAYGALGTAATLGAGMALDLATGFSTRLLAHGPPAHGVLAVFGWLLPLIVGVSYKLLPMFGLIHGHSERLARWNGWVWGVAVAVLASSLLLGNGVWPWALTVLVGSVAAFGWDVRRMLKKRLRKAPDTGLRFVAAGLTTLIGSLVLSLWPAWGGPAPVAPERLWLTLGLLALAGGLSTIVLGYLHRILPFLQWLRRYGDLSATGPLPQTKDLIDDVTSRRWFWPFHAGVAVLAGAVLSGEPVLVAIACVLWAVPATVLGVNLLAVLRR
jgi:hypothetical protein